MSKILKYIDIDTIIVPFITIYPVYFIKLIGLRIYDWLLYF